MSKNEKEEQKTTEFFPPDQPFTFHPGSSPFKTPNASTKKPKAKNVSSGRQINPDKLFASENHEETLINGFAQLITNNNTSRDKSPTKKIKVYHETSR